jgi:YggT family protein
MAALLYLLQFAVNFVVIAFLLRAVMPLVRADFRNPLGQAVLRFTDPVIRPLRKVLGPVGRVDVASFAAVYAAQYAGSTLLRLVAGGGFAPGRTALVAALDLVDNVLFFYSAVIIAYAVLSWFGPGGYNPASRVLAAICEPLLSPVRRILPALGGLDLSPILVLVLLQAARLLLH